MAAPLVLLTLVQPDLGTAIILGIVFISMILMGGLRTRSFLYLVGAGLAFLPVAWHFLKPYQRNRLLTFLDPDRDPLGAGYHVIQSQIAIGSGRLFGKGYLHGTQNRLGLSTGPAYRFYIRGFFRRMGLCRMFDFAAALFRAVYLLPGIGPAGERPLRRPARVRHDRDLFLACDDQRGDGGGTHAGRRCAAADGQLRRLGARLHDVRRRRDHERQHAALHVLTDRLKKAATFRYACPTRSKVWRIE